MCKDPKRGTILAVLLIVLVGLWMKIIFGGKFPAAARASLEPLPTPVTDNVVIDLQPRPTTSRGPSLLEWSRVPVAPMERNLFSVPLDYYPRNGIKTPEDYAATDGFWDRLAKSMTAKADQQEERRILIDNVRIQAAALKMQSTMMGGEPAAMVNGDVVREGSVVAGFRIVKIEARRMIVEREGVKLEILMK